MNKKKFYIGIVAVFLILTGALMYQRTTTISDQQNHADNKNNSFSIDSLGRTAEVTKIIDKPNRAEDGYYGIYAKDLRTSQNYLINATGYLNNPAPPSYFGEECVYIPKINIGQKIQFSLPSVSKDSDQSSVDEIFTICYKKSIGDPKNYYFKIEQ